MASQSSGSRETRDRIYAYGETAKEAREKLRQKLDALARNPKAAKNANTKLSDFLDEWMSKYTEVELKPSTSARYSGLVKDHIKPRVGNETLGKLTPHRISNFLVDLKNSGRSDDTRHKVYMCLRSAFRYAERFEYVPFNPCCKVDAPKVSREEAPSLSIEQIIQLVEAIKVDRYQAAYWVALTGGLRLDEVLGLRWMDLDFECREISIRVAITEVKGKPVIGPVKSRKGSKRQGRWIAMSDLVADQLVRHRVAMESEGHPTAGEAWVFVDKTGHYLYKSRFYYWSWDRVQEDAACDVGFHGLRHTAASLLNLAGADVLQIQKLLGHSDPGFTMRAYPRLFFGVERETARKVDEIMLSKVLAQSGASGTTKDEEVGPPAQGPSDEKLADAMVLLQRFLPQMSPGQIAKLAADARRGQSAEACPTGPNPDATTGSTPESVRLPGH